MVSPESEDGEPEAGLLSLFTEELPRSPLPLVSAMKGSREKQGVPPRELNVLWASSVKSKQKKSREDRDKDTNYNHKKNGKKGPKGNSSRGVGGKDKKQFRKAGGRSDRRYRKMDACEDLDDFNVVAQTTVGVAS